MAETTRPPDTTLRRPLALRNAALRAVRRRGLYLVDLGLAINRIRRARSRLAAATAPVSPVDRANADYLRRALDLELDLLVSLRDSSINNAESSYHALVALHGTRDASEEALAGLPAGVRSPATDRSPGAATPMAFALPIPLMGGYLNPAMPTLLTCAHGRLSGTGSCLTPPCPPEV